MMGVEWIHYTGEDGHLHQYSCRARHLRAPHAGAACFRENGSGKTEDCLRVTPEPGEIGGAGGPGRAPVTAGQAVPSMEPDVRCGQAAFGIDSLTVLKPSTTISLSSEPVSR